MTGQRRRELDPGDRQRPDIAPARAQHLRAAERTISTDDGPAIVTIDDSESPLAWLARRRGRDGKPLIEAHQFQAGERLRAEFTRANLMPRTTSNWERPISGGHRGDGGHIADTVIAARQRMRHALDAIGPEFSGLLLDVCCFLKGLEEVERERSWPPRSGKIVLQLALGRLARHYGYASHARGRPHGKIETWLAPGAEFSVESV